MTGGKQTILIAVLAACVSPQSAFSASDSVEVARFSSNDLSGWEEQVFKGHTRYRLTKVDGLSVLKAESHASASGMVRKIKIDLNKTPCMEWRWKIDGALAGLNEQTKGGDDYAARVYVVFSGGLAFWDTRALNYVWSGSRTVGTQWPNAFTSNSLNVAVQNGSTLAGKWISQRRNVLKDYRAMIGGKATTADAVALMTDTDNSQRQATAYYGDISFTSSC